MKDRAKDWLFIEEEVISSMYGDRGKEACERIYDLHKKGRMPFAEMKRQILKGVSWGWSTFLSIQEIRECFEMKEYYTANGHEYGDYYEDELKLSFMAD